jgi:hypothetical protein
MHLFVVDVGDRVRGDVGRVRGGVAAVTATMAAVRIGGCRCGARGWVARTATSTAVAVAVAVAIARRRSRAMTRHAGDERARVGECVDALKWVWCGVFVRSFSFVRVHV